MGHLGATRWCDGDAFVRLTQWWRISSEGLRAMVAAGKSGSEIHICVRVIGSPFGASDPERCRGTALQGPVPIQLNKTRYDTIRCDTMR